MTYRGEALPWFLFKVGERYIKHSPWKTQYFANGEYAVSGLYYNWFNRTWYETYPITVTIANEASYAPVIIAPEDSSEVSGKVTISFKAEGANPYLALIYAGNKLIGWKFLYNSTPPYDFTWWARRVENGQYDLKVLVLYIGVGYSSSEPVSVTVNNPPATPHGGC